MQYSFLQTNDPYALTPEDLIQKKVELLNLKDGELIIDLGAGDARSLICACKSSNVNAIGYEILEEALIDAKGNILKERLEDRIEIIEDSYFNADLRNANAVILYLTRTALGGLSLKLENELPKGARIVTHQFDLPAWEAKMEMVYLQDNGDTEKIYLYEKDF